MNGTYDIGLVILSIGVAVIASYVALDLAARVATSQGSKVAFYWLNGGAISMGTGIWSMHFIGMLAFKLPIPMSYNIPVTLLSLLIAMIVSGFALHTVGRDTLSMRRLLRAGLYMGIGIAAMHYTGMAAMQMEPPIRYDPLLFVLSVLIAIVAAMVALWIAFQLRSETVLSAFWKKAGSALVMGAAISGMHYTGMAAATFAPNSLCTVNPQEINNVWLAGTIGGFTFMFLITTLLISVFDARLSVRSAKFAETLRMSQQLIETLPNPIFFKGRDGRYLGVNKAWEKFFGLPRDTFIGKTVHDLYPNDPEIADRLHSDDQALWERPGTKVYETVITTPDGRRHDAIYYKATFTHADGSVAGLIGTIIDITERKEREGRYRAMFENAAVGITRVDLNGVLVDINQKFCDLLGYTRDELIGKTIKDITHPDDYGRGAAFRGQIMHGEMKSVIGEKRFLRKDGAIIWARRTMSAVRDDASNPQYVISVVEDITERKLAEEARAQLEAQLREAQKLEAVGTLAGGIAHDFNNILGAIIGNAALARKEVGAGHPALVSLDEIYKASQRAKNLVQQILAFSRRQPQQLRIQPLRPAVADAVKLLRATLPARVELAAAVSTPPLYVLADATQIQQVLMNLCTNAWHAMQGRAGRIEIGLDAVLLGAAAVSTLPGLQPGHHARLSVSDNGCGMDAATQARIFEPFFTTKAVDQGTGLGLSVVHGIIKAHHGAITLQSAPGAGTTFQIYFPAVPEPRAEALPAPAAPGSARGSGQHVLYVDDDEAMVFLVTRMLEELGYRISGYARAEEALEAVRADAGDFDLVVTDFSMPGLSGLEVAQELARIRPGLPVVITSGYITEELQINALRAGVRHLVNKPNTIDELCQIIQRLLATAGA